MQITAGEYNSSRQLADVRANVSLRLAIASFQRTRPGKGISAADRAGAILPLIGTPSLSHHQRALNLNHGTNMGSLAHPFGGCVCIVICPSVQIQLQEVRHVFRRGVCRVLSVHLPVAHLFRTVPPYSYAYSLRRSTGACSRGHPLNSVPLPISSGTL